MVATGGSASRCEPATIIGREQELAAVAGALVERGCMLVGPAGVGKSRLALEAARRVAGGAALELATATESAQGVPLGAFSHLLPAGPGAAANPIPAVIAQLRRREPQQAPVVIVDDAHFLDPASAALVLSLVVTGTARPLLTIRSGAALPDALVALWKDHGLLRLELQPLARDEVARLVDLFLGGPADGAVHRRAFELSQGNPLYVREFLLDAEGSGALGRSGGLFRLNGRRPRFRRLRELISARTGGLTGSGRLALELLALAAPLELDDLRALAGSDAIEELERGGLALVVRSEETQTAALSHPLYGEVVRDELPVEAQRRLTRALVARLAAHRELSHLDVVRFAAWKLDAGEPDPDLCLRASRRVLLDVAGVPGTGWGSADSELALRLADAAGAGLEPTLQAARAEMALDRFAAVEERLAPTEDEAAAAGPELAGAYLRTRALALCWRGRDSEALQLIGRAASWRDGRDWTALVAAIRGWSLYYAGRPACAVAELEPVVGRAGIAGIIRLDLLTVLVLVLGRLGLTDRCEALEPEIKKLTGQLERAGIETGWAGLAVDGFARVDAAREIPAVAHRLASALERAERRGDEGLASGISWALGRLELHRGRTLDAARLLERAAGGLTSGDPRNALGIALADLARAHAIRGDADAAAAALARCEAESEARPGLDRLRLELRLARAWMEVARGRPSHARMQLLALAEVAGENRTLEAEATYGALRLGARARRCAERLAALADAMEGELVTACAAHARAVADDDGQAQLASARRFAELEADLLAAEAAGRAARALQQEGRHASAREAAALAAKHARRCQGARTPAAPGVAEAMQLTSREEEIATLAAAGATSREIAQELVLSVRTVETHLYRVFKKLGVGDRHQLSDLLE